MPRHITLRQIEAFKAVVDLGTISRGAEVMRLSQPAMSKLIANMEFDTGLKLFDRIKGRLAPTPQAIRFYAEIDRIFAGVRQVEDAAEAIRREGQGRLSIGMPPALSGLFIEQSTSAFLEANPKVFCFVHTLGSTLIVERLIAGTLDVGVVGVAINNPYVVLEPFYEHPLVCAMPLGHPLAQKDRIEPKDLDKQPFVAFTREGLTGYLVAKMCDTYDIEPDIVLVASSAPSVCQFVAAGHGVTLLHPLALAGMEHRFVIRPFDPEILDDFQICRNADNRNTHLAGIIQEMRKTAERLTRDILER